MTGDLTSDFKIPHKIANMHLSFIYHWREGENHLGHLVQGMSDLQSSKDLLWLRMPPTLTHRELKDSCRAELADG